MPHDWLLTDLLNLNKMLSPFGTNQHVIIIDIPVSLTFPERGGGAFAVRIKLRFI